ANASDHKRLSILHLKEQVFRRFPIKNAESAFYRGDVDQANELLDQAAQSLGTSPENFRSIVYEFVTD
ncbi:MAG: hypothetical protein HRU19_28225, partial [Pseudobacteriovorax sp.]|nr:hypothetical protein [Pseudobacteriovorax sp.]